jgi:hypothetical protein
VELLPCDIRRACRIIADLRIDEVLEAASRQKAEAVGGLGVIDAFRLEGVIFQNGHADGGGNGVLDCPVHVGGDEDDGVISALSPDELAIFASRGRNVLTATAPLYRGSRCDRRRTFLRGRECSGRACRR